MQHFLINNLSMVNCVCPGVEGSGGSSFHYDSSTTSLLLCVGILIYIKTIHVIFNLCLKTLYLCHIPICQVLSIFDFFCYK